MREGGERQSRLPWGVSGGVVGAGQESLGGNKSKTDSRRETGKRPQRTVPERHRQPRDWRLLKATERRGGETRGQPGQRWLAPAAWGGDKPEGAGRDEEGQASPPSPPPGLTDTGAPALIEAGTAPQALSVLCPHHLAVHRPVDDPGGTPKVALSAPC